MNCKDDLPVLLASSLSLFISRIDGEEDNIFYFN